LPSPILTFSFITATLIGAAFHVLVGGDVRRFALYLIAAWLGFGVGHLAGVVFSLNLLNIGSLHLLPAMMGAGLALIFTYALASSRPHDVRRSKSGAR
jgi:uncharacterized membrane protein YjjP (DUF1212 family)